MRSQRALGKVFGRWLGGLLGCALVLLFTTAWSIPSNGSRWKQTGGPRGGSIGCVAVDIEDSQIVYAAVEQAGIYRSTDGGAHWSPITAGLDPNQEFLRILVDPIDRRTLYLATAYQGVWISSDAGGSWREWNEGLEAREAGTNGNNVANVLTFSADGKTLYFGTLGAGVWKRSIER